MLGTVLSKRTVPHKLPGRVLRVRRRRRIRRLRLDLLLEQIVECVDPSGYSEPHIALHPLGNRLDRRPNLRGIRIAPEARATCTRLLVAVLTPTISTVLAVVIVGTLRRLSRCFGVGREDIANRRQLCRRHRKGTANRRDNNCRFSRV